MLVFHRFSSNTACSYHIKKLYERTLLAYERHEQGVEIPLVVHHRRRQANHQAAAQPQLQQQVAEQGGEGQQDQQLLLSPTEVQPGDGERAATQGAQSRKRKPAQQAASGPVAKRPASRGRSTASTAKAAEAGAATTAGGSTRQLARLPSLEPRPPSTLPASRPTSRATARGGSHAGRASSRAGCATPSLAAAVLPAAGALGRPEAGRADSTGEAPSPAPSPAPPCAAAKAAAAASLPPAAHAAEGTAGTAPPPSAPALSGPALPPTSRPARLTRGKPPRWLSSSDFQAEMPISRLHGAGDGEENGLEGDAPEGEEGVRGEAVPPHSWIPGGWA